MKSQYKRLSHTVWLCKYHIIFCPKYRYKVLEGKVEVFVRNNIYRLCGQKDYVTIEEINIQSDHVHLIISIPPKYSVSEILGFLKGKIALKLFGEHKELTKRYWGRHIWSRGYCVSTVGLNEDQIKKYVKWQQEREQRG
ncbi:MAG: IS200/IS605 family transposase [Parcubacteria group bacterium CG11_big_fil_rev_8_21_14_0_20_39_22]|nr:MAG: IS200/IS605 family transposase [Parcubacteria group bacterium CG11_big_fil_rev_8_21_14_0_20_39_22]